MIRSLLDSIRAWIAVEDASDRIEGSGEPIMSPKHRRNPEAEAMLEDVADLDDIDDPRDRT